ncbi:MAG: hypothetical protein F6K35_28065, partial [Okeania sp. SIO2H7]|nr:hypothetical protein [Okeania sp. SIO2H7]
MPSPFSRRLSGVKRNEHENVGFRFATPNLLMVFFILAKVLRVHLNFEENQEFNAFWEWGIGNGELGRGKRNAIFFINLLKIL